MPHTTPTSTTFPSTLTLTITPPPTSTTNSSKPPKPPSNILLLLHGIGDTETPLTGLARSLSLPDTLCLSLRGPAPLPFDLGGYHWGDDIQFTQATGTLDMDAGFAKATEMVLGRVMREGLVGKCGYSPREVVLWGFGQGGCVALSVAAAAAEHVAGVEAQRELGGVICLGGVLPVEVKTMKQGREKKSPTPVLLLGGSSRSAVTAAVIERVKDVFENVEVCLWKREGDGMARNREEMMPIMRFLARRLRSRQGVPEGAVELT